MTVTQVTGRKKKDEAKWGIIFGKKTSESPVTITSIKSDGVFGSKDLLPGMVVLEVNGVKVQWGKPTEAAKLLAMTNVGEEATLTVESFTGKVRRNLESDKWGLTLKNSTKASGIYIASINPDGLFGTTELEKGMKIICINGKKCPKDAKDVIKMISKTKDDLEIVAIDCPLPTVREEPKPQLMQTSSEEDEETEPQKKSIIQQYFSCGAI